MKKKLMLLALGAVAFCASAFSQLAVNQNINGNVITGNIAAPIAANQTLALGTLITFTSSTPGSTFGQSFTYKVVLTPSSNPAGMLSDIANAINNTFNVNSVSGSGGTVSPNRFGSNRFEYSVELVAVPLDLGWSAFLCVGALGAVAAARARRKNQVQLV